jgi:two-component system cell cycle sensor histidine kinase/response regulator CckA
VIQTQLSKVLSEFARTLATDFSIQTILDQLVLRVVEVLPISGAGVALMAPEARPRYVAASDERSLRCERLQVEIGAGPSFAAHETGDVIEVDDLRVDDRFPAFARAAVEDGILAVLSFPLRQGDAQIGALNLYRTDSGPLQISAMADAKTLADVTAAYLLIAQARVDHVETSERARQSSLHDGETVQALQSSEDRKTAILASAIDAVITIDALGRIIEFNPAAELTFGLVEANAKGTDLAQLVTPPDPLGPQWVGLDRVLASSDERLLGRRFELVGTRADSSTFPAEVTMTPVEGVGPRFFIAFIRDLTRRDADDAEKRVLETRVQQTERIESLGQLAGVVAHDFNNLLTVILNYASFIAEPGSNVEDARHHATEIVSAAERAARLTQQLLLFARREPVRNAPIDLDVVIADIHDLLERAVGESVRLIVRTPSALPAFIGDRGQTEQVLMNLAVNARDAMPDGGTLTIDTELVQIGTSSFVQLTVTDTGEGMSAEVASHAFDPFFTTKRSGEGSGLGLSTVYGIVTDAGGLIELTSHEGHGTTFILQLPVAASTEGAELSASPADEAEAAPDGHETILIVEDQEAVRVVTATMLRRHGYTVLEAFDAPSAVALAATERFDLLLTDVVMPGRSGRELAETLRAGGLADRVLYMSGYSSDVFGSQRALDPSETIIHKPFSEGALLDAVRSALGSDVRPIARAVG